MADLDGGSAASSCDADGGGAADPGASGAPSDAQYLVLSASSGLSAERVLALTGADLTAVDSGAGAAYTLSLAAAGTAGTYAYPSSVTTDAKGRVTSVTAGSAPAALASTPPANVGTAAVGVGTTVARADHVHALPTVGPGAGAIGSALSAVTSATLDANGRVTAATATAGTANQVLRINSAGTAAGFGTLAAGAFAGTQTDGFVLSLSSGVPTWLAAASGVSGSGAATRLAFWSGASALTSDAGLTFASNVLSLAVSSNAGTVASLVSNTHAASASSHAMVEARTAAGGGNAYLRVTSGTNVWDLAARADLGGDLHISSTSTFHMARFSDANETVFFSPNGNAGTANTRQVMIAHWNAAGGLLSGPSLQSQGGASEMFNIIPMTNAVNGLGVADKGLAMYAADTTAGTWKRTLSYVHRTGPPELHLCRDGGSLALFGTGSFGSGVGVVFVANAATAPTTDPSGGVLLYAEGGILKVRDPAGNIVNLN